MTEIFENFKILPAISEILRPSRSVICRKPCTMDTNRVSLRAEFHRSTSCQSYNPSMVGKFGQIHALLKVPIELLEEVGFPGFSDHRGVVSLA